jgi:hypothetical protein
MDEVTRRSLLRSGLAAGAFFALQGCAKQTRRPGVQVTPRQTNAADWEFVPQRPDWLDDEPKAAETRTPGVISRSAWTRAKPKFWDTNPMAGINRITVHHDGMTPFNSTSQSAAAQRLENIRRAHVSSNGWADVGYHFVIDPGGRVWEARPLSLQGAHVKYNNEHNLGVMMMGNYDQQSPTSAASKMLDDFVSAMMRKYRVPVGRVFTHQEMRPTACPGRSLQRWMESTRARGGVLART